MGISEKALHMAWERRRSYLLRSRQSRGQGQVHDDSTLRFSWEGNVRGIIQFRDDFPP
jgi:hypothetical protein